MAHHLKFHSVEPGYCRVYYTLGSALYCVQDEGHRIYKFYRCTSQGEPQYQVKPDDCTFEKIPGHQKEDAAFEAWLVSKGAVIMNTVASALAEGAA
jgi:hypothetical protein